MSISGTKILADTIATIDSVGAPIYQTSYMLAPQAANGHQTGTVETVVGDITESTFNLTIQEKVANLAELQSGSVDNFTPADVFGGRI